MNFRPITSKTTKVGTLLFLILILSLVIDMNTFTLVSGGMCLPEGLGEQFLRTHTIFSGKVIAIEYTSDDLHTAKVTFAVDEAFKGVNSTTIAVSAFGYMTDTGATSPLALKEGERYLVYATYYEKDGMLHTSEGQCETLYRISDSYYYQDLEARTKTIAKIASAKNFSPEIISKLAPNKQMLFHAFYETWKVECKAGYDLIFKVKYDSPVCVKPETAKKLIERGFAKANSVMISDGY